VREGDGLAGAARALAPARRRYDDPHALASMGSPGLTEADYAAPRRGRGRGQAMITVSSTAYGIGVICTLILLFCGIGIYAQSTTKGLRWWWFPLLLASLLLFMAAFAGVAWIIGAAMTWMGVS